MNEIGEQNAGFLDRNVRTVAWTAVALALGSGAALLAREVGAFDGQSTQFEDASIDSPTSLAIESPNIPISFVCTIENPDGTTMNVLIDINGPETPAEVAALLGGSNMLHVLLQGINLMNETRDKDLAMVVGEGVTVIDVSGELSYLETAELKYYIAEAYTKEQEQKATGTTHHPIDASTLPL